MRWLAALIGSVSTLIVALVGLMFAFGKIPAAYEAACNFFSCPAQYKWIDSEPVTVSHYIKDETVFSIPSLIRSNETASAAWPIEGSRRYLKPPQATCAPAKSSAWKLHDGTIILPNDPLLTQGWISPSWVGEPESPDWNKFDQMAVAKFGWTPGFSKNNRCPANARCRLSPDEIKSHSTQIGISAEGCSSMYVGEDANYSPDSTSLTVTVRGKSDVESLWSIVVPTQTYAKLSPWSAIRY